jgi:hypothetical protein
MDPIGFGLENYDAEGKFRAKEANTTNDCPIDGKGEIVGVGPFHGPAELANVIIQSGLLNGCVTAQLFRFAQGRSALDDADRSVVKALNDQIGAKDFRFQDLIVDLVAAQTFFYRRVEK